MLSVSSRAGAIAALVLAMLVWGGGFPVAKVALAEIPPLLLALLRFGVACAILLPLAQARGGLALLPRPLPLGTLTLMGLTGIAIYYVALNLSVLYTTASEAALIQGAIPTATVLLALPMLGERLRPLGALGIGLSAVGLALVVLAGETNDAEAPDRLLGDALNLLSVGSWAVYTILRKRMEGVSGLAITAYGGLIGTLLLVPAAAYDLLAHPPLVASAGAWLAVLYLGAGPPEAGWASCSGTASSSTSTPARRRTSSTSCRWWAW